MVQCSVLLYYRVLLAGSIVRGINLVDKAKGERGGTRFARNCKNVKILHAILHKRGETCKKNIAAISKKTER